MYPVQLTGEHVALREFTASDLDQVYTLVSDDRVTRWLSFDSRSREQAQEMLSGILERAQAEPRLEYYLAVTPRTSDQVVGFARLGLGGVRAAKLGYAIHADHWGRGYATDAARTLVGFGFTTLDLHRISAAIGPDNTRSIAVVKRLGFQYEGRIRDHVFTNGAWRDSLLYSVLSNEWVARRAA
mgnify:CR=1 FL=1